MHDIKAKHDCDCDPLRAIWAIRCNHAIRPWGWMECPGERCRKDIHAAWDRRRDREWAMFEELVKKHIWLEQVEEEVQDG